MKITVIHGQNHKGNTYMIAHELAEKIGGEVTEFFLPRDFDEPCLGCWTCFNKDLTHCPHYKKLKPLMDAMDEADVVILASPVYVYHATGQMMAFLDHFGTRWMVHRPDARAFQKQGVAIATAAGGGMASTTKDLYHSMFSGAIRGSTAWDLLSGQRSHPRSRKISRRRSTRRPTGWQQRSEKSCLIQTNTQDPHVVFDDTLDAQSILEVRAGLWLLGRTWMAR